MPHQINFNKVKRITISKISLKNTFPERQIVVETREGNFSIILKSMNKEDLELFGEK